MRSPVFRSELVDIMVAYGLAEDNNKLAMQMNAKRLSRKGNPRHPMCFESRLIFLGIHAKKKDLVTLNNYL